MDKSLTDFIDHARAKGMDHGTIRMLLLSSGWKEKDVAQALSAQTLDMRVPLPPDVGGARDAFFHLLTFACLTTGIVSLIVLLFTYIDRLFPDPATSTFFNDDLSSIRWWMASLIVTFPIFLWITRKLLREMEYHPERSRSGVRRWLTYLTLFLAAMTMLGDGIALVFNVLDGELSLRFLLKVLVILVLAGLTFTYYFLSLRSDPRSDKTFHRSFGALSVAIVVVAIVWGLFVAGSPGSQRLRRFDDRRVQDLQIIQSEIQSIAYDGQPVYDGRPMPAMPASGQTEPPKPIPATLQEVVEKARYQRPNILDPQTGQPYGYIVHTPRTYDLCATFSLARDQQYDVQWNHPAGRHCFSFDVTKGFVK